MRFDKAWAVGEKQSWIAAVVTNTVGTTDNGRCTHFRPNDAKGERAEGNTRFQERAWKGGRKAEVVRGVDDWILGSKRVDVGN